MKKITLILSLLIATVAANAIPAKRGVWKSIKLANGTEVRAQLVGDEHHHFWKTADGSSYVFDVQKKHFVKANEAKLMKQVNARRARIGKARAERLAKLKDTKALAKGSWATNRFEGTKKGLVILVNFDDTKFLADHTQTLYNRICNEENFTSADGFKGSVRDYFKAQSLGVFDLQFDVVGPVPLAHGYAYYGAADEEAGIEDDGRANEMVIEACMGVVDKVNFADYDWDGDGFVDQVFVLYAGKGSADTGDNDLIWPHEYELSGYGYEDEEGNVVYNSPLELDGVKIDTYACANEIMASGTIDGIGTFCHEFSHCLGYPDMYDTNYEGNFGMGEFDLMDGGAYNGNGFLPAGYTSWERMEAGWLEPIELNNEDKAVTGMKAINEGGEAYIMYNQANKNEYFLLENRQKKGWDAELPDNGLMITHVDYDEELFANNIVNTVSSFSWQDAYDYYIAYYEDYAASYNLTLEELLDYWEMTIADLEAEAEEYADQMAAVYNPHQRMTIVHADGDDDKAYYDADYGYYEQQTTDTDLYPIEDNNVFDNNSVPNAKLYYPNSDGRKYLNHGVEAITQNADGTISFNFKAVSTKVFPEVGTVLFYESFNNHNGKGGNDNLWSGNIASAKFDPDLDGWEVYHTTDWESFTEGTGYGANKCARFGTSRYSPVVLSPLFSLAGKATLTFKVAPWGTDDKGIEVYLENNEDGSYIAITEDGEEMTAEQWNEYSFDIEGDDSDYYLSFYPDKRIFLDEVKVVYTAEPEITGIEKVESEGRKTKISDKRIYTIDGRYVGTNMNSLQHGIYIINGKKIVK